MLELVTDVITIERFLDMWRNHGNPPFSELEERMTGFCP
jgi:hypothetical protein